MDFPFLIKDSTGHKRPNEVGANRYKEGICCQYPFEISASDYQLYESTFECVADIFRNTGVCKWRTRNKVTSENRLGALEL